VLRLDDSRWGELRHAYGTAADTPALLRQLSELPTDEADAEPWFRLWSSLAHQGDVYPASYAAVPHVVAALASAPTKAPVAFFHFPTWVEICRHRARLEVPEFLEASYFEALRQFPSLVAAAAQADGWSHERAQCTLAAIAVAQRHHAMAEAILELSAETLPEFFAWFEQR
jgi:hypothetical protein